MKAIILAGGYAHKLYPLTENEPKALLSIGEKTLLGHMMDKLQRVDEVDEVLIVTNNKFVSHFESWKKSYQPSKPVKVLNDGTYSSDDRLGAVGDLNFVLHKENVRDDVLVISGDNLFEFSLRHFVGFYRSKQKTCVAVYALDRSRIAGRYGAVMFNEDKRVTAIEEKPVQPKSNFVSTGCYLLGKHDLDLIEEYVRDSERWDNFGHFLAWLIKRSEVYAFLFTERWFGINSFQALEEAYNSYEK